MADIITGDCLEVLRGIDSCSIDACVTDPPAGIAFMGKAWDGSKGGRDQWIAWLASAMAEVLRALKPGGHAVVWALPRTSHWTGMALETAGFEVRDCLTHLFGSGFPKSHDISKALDKQVGAEREAVGPSPWNARKPHGSAGVNSVGLNATPGAPDITAPSTDDAKQWDGWGSALKPAAEMWWLVRKPLVSPAVNVLAVVESALRSRGVLGDIKWQNERAKGAKPSKTATSSLSTDQPSQAGISVENAGEKETAKKGKRTARSTAKSTENGPRTTSPALRPTGAGTTQGSEAKCSQPMVGGVHAAAKMSRSSSSSTMSTAAAQPTGHAHTGRSTQRSDERASRPDLESFAGIATGLTGSMATVRIKRGPNGYFVWPNDLPRQVGERRLTIAANVLEHGTGAVNIDGTRVGNSKRVPGSGRKATDAIYGTYGAQDGSESGHDPNVGRWPPNVLLSHHPDCGAQCEADCPVRMLDEQSGDRPSGIAVTRNGGGRQIWGARNTDGPLPDSGYSDSGGASRFFPRFRYSPKPSTAEREAGLGGVDAEVFVQGYAGNPSASPDRPDDIGLNRIKRRSNIHPTVKSIDLMRWLCRLITPPGGLVVDPFCGSGTTGMACKIEGFRFVGIEQSAQYADIARKRIAACRFGKAEPLASPKAKADQRQMGLFDD